MMEIECKCTMRERMAGDGCDICNTSLAIDMQTKSDDLRDELIQAGFSEDQAYYISFVVYQPLINLITSLNEKIDQVIQNTP